MDILFQSPNSSIFFSLSVPQIHKEWLARRAASRVNTNSTQRTTYLRKLIKFKNEHEPLSENDISFVPHFDHNNRDTEHQSAIGIDDNRTNMGPVSSGSNNRPQDNNDNEYGLRPVGSAAEPDEATEQNGADRYRYDVASESNLSTGENRHPGGSMQSRLLEHHSEGQEASNEIPPVTSTAGAPAVMQQQNDAIASGWGNENDPTEQINAVAKINEPVKSGTVDDINNDLPQVGAAGRGTHKSVDAAATADKRKSWHNPAIINNETTDDESSTSSSSGASGFTTTTTTEVVPAKVDEQDKTRVDGNVTIRNGFGPWSNWTACSRSCGGGVKSQQRKCWRRE